MKFSEVPSSFVDKRMANTTYINAVITQPPSPDAIDYSFDKKKLPTLGTQTKSSINNDPIFMVYASDESKLTAKGDGMEPESTKKRKSLWRLPAEGGAKRVWWFYTWPIKLILTMTIPNPKTYRRLYPLTFFMCIIWIGLNAYMIVWMITVMGKS